LLCPMAEPLALALEPTALGHVGVAFLGFAFTMLTATVALFAITAVLTAGTP